MLTGAMPMFLNQLKLTAEPDKYYYLRQGESSTLQTMDDQVNWKAVQHSLDVLDFTQQEQKALFAIVASVLHLGNVKFESGENEDAAVVTNPEEVATVSELLGCKQGTLLSALQNRTIEAKLEKLKSPLNVDQALYACDALAKGIYDRLFSWIVPKINSSLSTKGKQRSSLMGLLDIYGFEIFQLNFFEQFCINYCNEKLQQLFIELTLKLEQEEYEREGIQDEECLQPGDTTDLTFLDKVCSMIGNHPHFVSHIATDNTTRKTIKRDEFPPPGTSAMVLRVVQKE